MGSFGFGNITSPIRCTHLERNVYLYGASLEKCCLLGFEPRCKHYQRLLNNAEGLHKHKVQVWCNVSLFIISVLIPLAPPSSLFSNIYPPNSISKSSIILYRQTSHRNIRVQIQFTHVTFKVSSRMFDFFKDDAEHWLSQTSLLYSLSGSYQVVIRHLYFNGLHDN